MSEFSESLARGVLVFDGAMGTELYRRHVFTNRCFDELCLSEPKLITEIHQAYCDAGADVLTTNTFGANRVMLAQFGLAERQAEIIRAGVRLARQVAQSVPRRVFVVGSVGPLPQQPEYASQIDGMIAEQVSVLREEAVDAVIFETQPTRAALEQCARAMTRFPDVPYILSFVVDSDAESAAGEPIERVIAPIAEVPQPTAWGINCGVGPDGLLLAVERAVKLTRLPLIVQPNAGMPKEVGNRRIYLCSPEYLTTYALRYINLGVSAVGGCCGTTPDHIREMAKAVKPLSRAAVTRVALSTADAPPPKQPAPLAQRTQLGRRLVERQWITTVELVPPRGYDLTSTIEKSKLLRQRGVSAINIPDGPRASSRLSPIITAYRIQQEAGIEAILHFCCRDRNLIGMQADLLGCAACGVRNILFVTGDPPKMGNYPNATGVFDTDSIGMAAVQRRLNCGLDLGSQPIEPQTQAVIGVGLDPSALDLERELDRFRQKVDAGAEFAISQPVFDPDALLRFLDHVQQLGVPVIAGIWPLASYRNALFMRNEVPGVVVPDWVMERMASQESREGQLAMGIEIAREAVARVRDRVAGIQVSAPMGKVETALAVIEA